MAYLDVIPLADAKIYLAIDDGMNDRDNEILRMIKSALSYVEQQTNVIIYQRSKTYLMLDGCAYVYDAPIDSVTSPTDYDADETTRKHNYSIYNYGSETTDLTLLVGYLDPNDVPSELIDVAYEIIDLLYYQHETGKTVEKDLSELSRGILHQYKRFII